MTEWTEALRGYVLPLEVVLLVAALVTLGVVIAGRRRKPTVLPKPTAWMLGTVAVVAGLVALVSGLWTSAAAMALLMVALALAVVAPRAAHPTED